MPGKRFPRPRSTGARPYPYLWPIVVLFLGPILWGLVVAVSLYVLRPMMMRPGYEESWNVGTFWIAYVVGGVATPAGILVGLVMIVATFVKRRKSR